MPATHAFFPEVGDFLQERSREFGRISALRKTELNELAEKLRLLYNKAQHLPLVFICTHNSRRSQLGQVWATAAAAWHGVEHVQTFSGGTEATAFHPNAVNALCAAGLQVSPIEDGTNPVYQARMGPDIPPVVGFSKRFDHPSNPAQGSVAVMVCAEADTECPFVPGAALRFPLPYEDPKAADGTHRQAETYAERSAQIAREMLYLFSLLA